MKNLDINNKTKAYIKSFSLTAFIFFIICIIYQVTPFGDNSICTNDGIAQYIPFLSEFTYKIKNSESLFYSFNGGLGFNFYGTICYYLMSPFNLIALFFKQENMKIAIQLIIIIKMCFISLSMTYYLLNRFKKQKYNYAIIFSLAYTFSYFFIGYMYNFMWLDCIILLPFILRGLETINTKKGKLQYTICLALCMISNFYISFMICIFLFFYYFLVINFKNRKDLVNKTICFFNFSIIGAMIASIVLIPMGINILNMNSQRTGFPDFSFFNNFTYIFSRHMPFIEIKTLSSNEGDANLFCTVIIFILAILFIFNKMIPKKRKIGMVALASLLFFSLINTIPNFIMHGFYKQRQIPNRFAFLYVFLIIVMAYESFLCLRGLCKKHIQYSCIGLLLIIISTYIDLNIFKLEGWDLIVKIISFIYLILFLFLYFYLLTKKHKNKLRYKKHFFKKETIILIFMIIEILLGITEIQNTTLGTSYDLQKNYQDAIILANDNSFHRKELLSSDVTNAPTLYNIKGLTSFNSIINSKTAGILGQLGFASGENYYRYFGHTPLTDSLFGIKYIYSKYDEELPFNFKHIDKINDINIYKNKYVLPIGFILDTSSLEENYANKLDNLNNLTNEYGKLFEGIPITTNYDIDNPNIKMIDNSNFSVTTTDKNETLEFTIDNISNKNVYIYTKCNEGCNLTINKNDKIITSESYSGYISYIGDISLDDTIKISYKIKNICEDKKITIFLGSLNQNVFESFYEDTLNNSLKNVKYKGNQITATFESNKNDNQLFFTIPFDKGWNIFIDNKKVETKNIKDAFIGINIDEGKHNILLKYTPQEFFLGVYISLIGILILTIYLLITKGRLEPK